jgi:putative oxidoreductase
MNLGLLILRLVVGAFFAGHGAQKLFGSFGGHGPEGTAGFFETLGMRPGKRHAYAAGAAELGGGVLLILGFLTPFAAAAITAVMTVAIITVHAKNGPWSTDGGYEYNAVIMAAVFALAGAGAGAYSIDHGIGWGIDGTAWAIGELVVGVLGGLMAYSSGQRFAEAQAARRTGPASPRAATVPEPPVRTLDPTPTGRFAREGEPATSAAAGTPHTAEAPLERTPVDRQP